MEQSKRIVAPQGVTQSAFKPNLPSKPVQTLSKPPTSKADSLIVGYEKDSNKLVTLKDLYEGAKVKQESQGVMFTPLITKELKKNFDKAYTAYKNSIGDTSEIEPNCVRDILKTKCTEFFGELRAEVDRLKTEVRQRILNSDASKELEKLICENEVVFDPQIGESFEKQKELFDQKIAKFHFAGIIKRKEAYEELLKKVDNSKEHMDRVFAEISDLGQKIIQVKEDAVGQLDVDMESLVDDTVKFDVCSQEALVNKADSEIEILDIGDKSIAHLISNSEGCQGEVSTVVSAFSNSSSTWSNFHDQITSKGPVFKHEGTQIKRLSPDSGAVWEKLVDTGLYYVRFVHIHGTQDLYVIGGTKDSEGNQPTSQVALLRGKDSVTLKQPMFIPRSKIALTAARIQDQKVPRNFIFAVGGQESQSSYSRSVERYHVRANIWQQLPSLVTPRGDASAVVLGDWLYVFGGVTANASGLNEPLKSIERLYLKETQQKEINAFHVFDIKLPSPVSNIGILPLSNSETLLLGGFYGNGNSDQKLKFQVISNCEQTHNDFHLDILSKLDRGDFFREQVVRAAKHNLVNPEEESVIIYGEYFQHEFDLGAQDFPSRSVSYN